MTAPAEVTGQLTGIGVSAGVVVGTALRMAPRPELPAPRAVTDVAAERTVARQALAAVTADLTQRAGAVQGPAADVLAAQAEMSADPSLAEAVEEGIDTDRDAVYSVHAAFGTYRAMFESSGGFLADRVTDLDDIRDRVVATLLGLALPGVPRPGHPFILVAADLAPADTATLDPDSVLALVTERGGPTSHTAILARGLGIPAVVACPGAAGIPDGARIRVDGTAGRVDVGVEEAPDSQSAIRHTQPSTVYGRTADGQPVKLLVNVGDAAEPRIRSEGVGLFRTEFLFLSRQQAPDVDEQRQAYARVFKVHPGQTMVVRTLDAGADKPLPFLTLAGEANPALGVRGFRTARRSPEILDGQLEAISGAAREAPVDLWVMAPMVTTPAEAADFAARARAHGIERVGVMIEVPAAALRVRQILDVVDFVSIGTNDLSQYVMATDRESGELAELLDPWQPALLQLLAECGRAGGQAGKPVGVCGEAAADPLLAPVLVGLGITSLSMSPGALPAVAESLARVSAHDCVEAAQRALAASDPASARAAAGLA